jgi:hypothetical protein
MTAKLRHGPLPPTDTVSLNITMTAALKHDLDRYAELHGEVWGHAADVKRLIPYMLEAFLASDPAYRGKRRGGPARTA